MIKLNEANLELFHQAAIIIHTNEDKKYFYLPYWLEVVDDQTVIMHKLGDLPKDLKEAIEIDRDGVSMLDGWL